MSGFFVIKKKIFVENKKFILKGFKILFDIIYSTHRILGLKIIKLNLSQKK